MSDKAIEEWTTRLRTLAPDLGEPSAHDFVQGLYKAARRDLDQEKSEAEYERDE